MLIQLQNYLTFENIYFWANFGTKMAPRVDTLFIPEIRGKSATQRKSDLLRTGEREVLRGCWRREQAEQSEGNRCFTDHFHPSESRGCGVRQESPLSLAGRTRWEYGVAIKHASPVRRWLRELPVSHCCCQAIRVLSRPASFACWWRASSGRIKPRMTLFRLSLAGSEEVRWRPDFLLRFWCCASQAHL